MIRRQLGLLAKNYPWKPAVSRLSYGESQLMIAPGQVHEGGVRLWR